jgi:thiol:disulfide interchange protein DsbD
VRAGGAARTRKWRVGLRIASAAVIVGTVLLVRPLASEGPIAWVGYTPARFAEARSRGSVIVMDFTAEWCLNCKALEAGVLDTRRVVELLHSPGVVPMRVDLTTANPDGQAKLKELHWVGIPLLAVFGPGIGYTDPIRYDSYTPEMVQAAVSRARSAP